MALVEDVLGGGTGVAVAVGAAALVLPAVAPHLSPPVRSVLRAGLTLFLEAESDAEGRIIKGLADHAVRSALAALSGPGTKEKREHAARAAVQHFSRRAHARAHRYASSEQDRDARYRRHVRGMHRALASARQAGADSGAVQDLSRIIEDL
jgi:hypothetical protein